MLKKIQMIVVMTLFLIVLVGCVRNVPNEVGIWYSEKESIKMTLTEDGAFYIVDASLEHGELLDGKYRIEGDKLLFKPRDESEMANTYTLDGDTLVLTYEGYTSTLKRVEE